MPNPAPKIVFLLLMVFLLAACSKKEPIRIGFVGSLTGRNADLGVAARDATLMVAEELNRTGGIDGHPVEVIVKDDAQDPETAVKVVDELIRENVVAIVGHIASSMTMATLPAVNRARIVMVSPTSSSNDLSGQDDYFFRVMEPNRLFARHQAETCRKLGIRRVSVIYDLQNKAYTVDIFAAFREELVRNGGVIISEVSFDSAEKPAFLPLVRQLDLKKSNGVLVLGSSVDTITIIQQIRKADPSITILSGACGIAQRDLLQAAGKTLDNVVFTLPVDIQCPLDSYREFSDAFEKRYHYAPTMAAVLAYDATNLIAVALKKNSDPGQLRATIKGIGSFAGVQGPLVFDQYGDPSRLLHVIRYRDGREEIIR